jgi:hypothetical protein
MRRFVWKQAILAALLAGSVLIGCGPKKSHEELLAATYMEKLSKKDWRGIYNMASDEEKKRMAIDQEQYVRLLEIVTEGFPTDLGCEQVDFAKTSETERCLAVRFKSMPLMSADLDYPRNMAMPITFGTIKGRWYPWVANLPLQIILFQQEDKPKMRRRMLRAMEESRTPFITRTGSRMKLRIEDQRLVVQGKLEQAEAYR